MTSATTTYNYRVVFTPSCEKDSPAVTILGTYATEDAAKEALTEFLGTYLGDKSLDDYNETACWSDDPDDKIIHDVQQYRIPTMTVADYSNLLAYDFIHFNCGKFKSYFWIMKIPTSVSYGTLRRYIQGLLV